VTTVDELVVVAGETGAVQGRVLKYLKQPTHTQSPTQTDRQTDNQPIYQSINPSIDRSIDQLTIYTVKFS